MGCDGERVAPATTASDDNDDDVGCPMCRSGNVDGSDHSGNGAGEPALVAGFPSGNMSCKTNTAN